MRPNLRTVAACTAVIAALVAPAAARASWSTPVIAFQDAGATLFAAAGDPSGRAFLVAGGSQPDVPLAIAERIPRPGTGTDLNWGAERPLDGSAEPFATSGVGRSAMRAAAAGEGAGALVFRLAADGGDELGGALRNPGERFGSARRILSAAYGWLSDPAIAVSPNGSVAVAFASQKRTSADRVAGGPRPAVVDRGHVAVITRVAGDPWRRVQLLTSGVAGPPAVGVGSDDRPVVAWLRGSRVEASIFDDAGRRGPVRRIGSGRPGSRVAVAAGAHGRSAVVWADAARVIHVARRAGTRFAAGRRVQDGGASTVGGLTAAIDDRGRVFAAWRDGSATAGSIVVAHAGLRGRFTVSTITTGAGLGDPAIVARPGGGAIVAWRAPGGWSSAASSHGGAFESPSTASTALGRGDETLRVPALFAGPAEQFDLVWRQNLLTAPVPGPAILTNHGEQAF